MIYICDSQIELWQLHTEIIDKVNVGFSLGGKKDCEKGSQKDAGHVDE